MVASRASRSVGPLVLGYYDAGNLVYAGRVGTGWSADQARSLHDDLKKINSKKPQVTNPLPLGAEKGVRWADPRLVCEIEFRGWTPARLLRAASFNREDKPAEEIVLEMAPKTSKALGRKSR